MISPKKKLLMSLGPTPFQLSGTFATDLDGFNSVGSRPFLHTTNAARTSPGAAAGAYDSVMTMILPFKKTRGLRITFSAYARNISDANFAKIIQIRDSRNNNVLASASTGSNNSKTYQLVNLVYDHVESFDLIFRMSVVSSGSSTETDAVRFDDWVVEGRRA